MEIARKNLSPKTKECILNYCLYAKYFLKFLLPILSGSSQQSRETRHILAFQKLRKNYSKIFRVNVSNLYINLTKIHLKIPTIKYAYLSCQGLLKLSKTLSLLLKTTLERTTRKENLEGLEVSGIYQHLV